MTGRLSYHLFTHITAVHQSFGYWRKPGNEYTAANYAKLQPWIDLAKGLEAGFFDTVFIGDTLGPYDVYKDDPSEGVRAGAQFPSNDPSVLISALATHTEHLGFAITSSVLQAHPFEFARRMSTLDHLTDGRVGWNIVTSYLDSAARNLGRGALPPDGERYDIADEYVEVVYKLWEQSWDGKAKVLDPERNMVFDPGLIHKINHVGKYFKCEGPHMVEPSPQRTPVLFQAGGSPRGKDFASKNAEVTFCGAFTPEFAAAEIAELRQKAVAHGRRAEDILSIVMLAPVIGSTEEEARRKYDELLEYADYEALATLFAARAPIGGIEPGMVISDILADPDAVGLSEAVSFRAPMLISMLAAVPDKALTFKEWMIRYVYGGMRAAGTPEQIADKIQEWADAGATGFNLAPVFTLGWIEEWNEHMVPVLHKRGLLQREYAPGTLREKLFGKAATLPGYHAAGQLRNHVA
jgi:FMN-dependent oxidoreductase (nitrilotriacetate monooxygenase family)